MKNKGITAILGIGKSIANKISEILMKISEQHT